MGEPGGIGPEVIVKALTYDNVLNFCKPLIIGDYTTVQEALALTNLSLSLKKIETVEEDNSDEMISVLEPFSPEQGRFPRGKPSQEAGRAVYEYIKTAVNLAMENTVAGIVTAPIAKESLKRAGYPWPGHTELLAELTHTKDYAMMLVGGPLRVILVTIHMALRDVPDKISKERVGQTIRLAKKAAHMLNLKKPRIGVAGLNPHAGEAGIFGIEEREHISPAIKEAQEDGIEVSGPYPPDIIFNLAYKGEIDIVCSMYHDQGLIPLKMIAFDRGVNLTVGLPIIRTSPDHGTAFDRAWQNRANPLSMIEAIKMAASLKKA